MVSHHESNGSALGQMKLVSQLLILGLQKLNLGPILLAGVGKGRDKLGNGGRGKIDLHEFVLINLEIKNCFNAEKTDTLN